MSLKECLYRELKYALAGAGGVLEGLVAQDHIKLDMRDSPPSDRSTDDYPWLIFRRVTNSEDNQVNYARERIEIELIGLHSSASKGDDLLEEIRTALVDEFAGTTKTRGKFTAVGAVDSGGGLKLKCHYINTVDGFDDTLEEKAHIMIFIFTHVRT